MILMKKGGKDYKKYMVDYYYILLKYMELESSTECPSNFNDV